MIIVCKELSSVLFYLGSIFSYVLVYYVFYLCVTPKRLFFQIWVMTIVGDSLVVDMV